MRSKLFVPASRPELFPKALRSAADSLSFDLEDAVAEARKAQAREVLESFLANELPHHAGHGKTIIVRINAMDTAHFEQDVAAVVSTGVDLINLPKPGSVHDVQDAVQLIERLARERGLSAAPGLVLNIETPQGLRTAAELAKASTAVKGLQLGLGDMFEPYGVSRRENSAIAQAMFTVRMAAAEAGVWAYDGAFANIQDEAGFRAEAELSKALGFRGKTCIHPSQIGIANAVYQPSAQEIEHALKVVRAAEQAEAQSLGAYVVEGKMIDKPFVIRAQSIVQSARQAGLLAD